jgi:acyl-coenzyme A thioesterase PaaI-like protein
MAVDLTAAEPYSGHLRARVVEASPERAVVEQPADPEVDNHVKVRHASALYTAAHEASRQLLLATLGERAQSVRIGVADSEIAYRSVGLGVLTTTAERSGEGWDSLEADLDAGKSVQLENAVVATGEDGKPVITFEARWTVSPAA